MSPPIPELLFPLLDGALVRLRLPAGRSLELLLAALSTDPEIEQAQPNYDYGVSKDKTSPKTAPQYTGEAIRLDAAHRLARGNGVLVAVIDTAIEAAHPELVGTIAGMFDAVGEGPSPAEPHGTEIAGILAAHAELTGVAPEAKLLSVRAFRSGKNAPVQSTSLQLLKGFYSGVRRRRQGLNQHELHRADGSAAQAHHQGGSRQRRDLHRRGRQ